MIAPTDVGAIRRANLEWLAERGFVVAAWLPIDRGPRRRRGVVDIARRLMALEAVFTWASAPEKNAPTDHLSAYIERNDLRRAMTPSEREIVGKPRSAARREHRATMGWRLENAWSLAWVLGLPAEPACDGEMIPTSVARSIVFELMPKRTESVDTLVARVEQRPIAEVTVLGDRFYCCHNSTRSAQLGGRTVPPGFNPVIGGGVIRERRHALTWCLSPDTDWDATDLGT